MTSRSPFASLAAAICGFTDLAPSADGVERCPFCSTVTRNRDGFVCEFRDDASLDEFALSGLCQPCQDRTFGARS